MLANMKLRSFLLIMLLFGFFSCERSKEIGFGLVPREEVGVFFTDTLGIKTSTVLARVNTTNANALLVGQYQDPVLGEVKAQTYFQVVPDTLRLIRNDENNLLIYDSLVVELNFSYFYGDLDATQTFALHRLTESISREAEYTNRSGLSFNPIPEKTFTLTGRQLEANPNYRIKLSDFVGLDVFEDAKNNVTRQAFIDNFKGFVLVSQANPGEAGFITAFGAVANSRMALYYHEDSQTPFNRVLPFQVFAGFRFNQISSNRENTLLSNQLNNLFDEVSSTQTEDLAFVQAGVGLQTKISFPSLQSLKNRGNVAINRAEIVIKPLAESTDVFAQPNGIILYESDGSNKVLRSGEGENAFDLIVQVEGRNPFGFDSPLILNYNARNEEFVGNITTHLQLLFTGVKKNPSILISPSETAGRVNRLIINNQQNSPFAMKLRVFYTVFN